MLHIIVSARIYVIPGTKNPKLIIDQNEYSVHEKLEGKTRWRCNSYHKTKCRSRLLTFGKVVRVRHSHNHTPLFQNRPMDGLLSHVVTIIRE